MTMGPEVIGGITMLGCVLVMALLFVIVDMTVEEGWLVVPVAETEDEDEREEEEEDGGGDRVVEVEADDVGCVTFRTITG